MRYVSVFSGIEAASVAWSPLGWEPVCFSEIEPFPSAVLAERFPEVPNLGDITKVDWSAYAGTVDIVVGGSPCFVAGTLVLTESGFRPIETIKVGDLVMTHKGRLRRVTKVGSNVSDTILLKGQGSVGIECTRNHPFMSVEKKPRQWDKDTRRFEVPICDAEWTNAEDMEGRFWLNIGEFEPTSIPPFDGSARGERGKGYIDDFEFSEDFFYFVGRWLGDGWANVHKRKDRVDSQMKRVYLCCSHAVGDELQHRLESIGLHFCRGHERTAERFTFSSTQLFDWITSNFGVHAAGKNMPAWCFGMRLEFRQALLDGYLDSDGTPFENGYKSSTISRALVLGMKTLAATLGIPSSVVRSENDRDCTIEGRHVNEHANYCQSYYKSTRSSFFSDGGWYGKVRSVAPCRKNQTVYNLEVEDDHTYTADAVVCHNCQSFSVAGKREGLAGASGLMFEYIRAVRELRPRFFVWENVPGALSSEDGAAFGQLLSEMDDLGYGVAWRVLDAQFFGVAQRRRRVFLVGCLGDPGRAAEILFEPDGLRWDTPTSREKRKELAGASGACAGCDSWAIRTAQKGSNGCGISQQLGHTLDTTGPEAVSYAVRMREGKPGGGKGPLVQTDVSGTLATGNDQTIFQPIAFKWHQGSGAGGLGCQEGVSPTIDTVKPPAVCFTQNTRDDVRLLNGDGSLVGALAASPGAKQQNYVCYADDETPMVLYDGLLWTVRRLMPVECERLQGFPDGWTDIPWHGKDHAPDGPRYKAIGNSMCVQVMRWIGERIADAAETRVESHGATITTNNG